MKCIAKHFAATRSLCERPDCSCMCHRQSPLQRVHVYLGVATMLHSIRTACDGTGLDTVEVQGACGADLSVLEDLASPSSAPVNLHFKMCMKSSMRAHEQEHADAFRFTEARKQTCNLALLVNINSFQLISRPKTEPTNQAP